MVRERYQELKERLEKLVIREMQLLADLKIEKDFEKEYKLRELKYEKNQIQELVNINAILLGINDEIIH